MSHSGQSDAKALVNPAARARDGTEEGGTGPTPHLRACLVLASKRDVRREHWLAPTGPPHGILQES